MMLQSSRMHAGRCSHASSSSRAPSRSARVVRRSTPSGSSEPSTATPAPAPEPPVVAASVDSATSSREGTGTTRRRQADSTDAVASFLSRRFGLAGGLAWLGVLAVGTLGEQVKTRLEVAAEKDGTRDVSDAPEVVLPSGAAYQELRVGGGQSPIKGYLVIVDYVGKANDVQFENTKARGKPIVFLFGSRPLTGGMCPGVEQVLATMKAGGKRRIRVPPELGFGDKGFVLRPTEHVPEKQGIVPPGAELEYELELLRVSIPPS